MSKRKQTRRATVKRPKLGRGSGWKYGVTIFQADPGDGVGVDGGHLCKLSDGSLFMRLSAMGPLPPGHNAHAEIPWDRFASVLVRSHDRGLSWREVDTDETLPAGLKAIRKRQSVKDMSSFHRGLVLSPERIQRTPRGALVTVDSHTLKVTNKQGDRAEGLGRHVLRGGKVSYVWDRLMSVTSMDEGRTWKKRQITEVGDYAFLNAWGGANRQGALTLPNGDVIGVVYGHVEPVPPTAWRPYALRSADDGKSWTLIPIPCLKSDGMLSETDLVLTATGKLIATIRHQGSGDCYLRQSDSTDGGWTWSRARKMPMWGYPSQTLQLKSGALLCVYGYRFRPFGCRVCMSYNDGKTWDIKNEKILRDDSGDLYHGVSYPSTVQLDDGTLYTAIRVTKPAAIGKERVGMGWAPPELLHRNNPYSKYMSSAVMGYRYTEDYVRPNGRVFWKASGRRDDPE